MTFFWSLFGKARDSRGVKRGLEEHLDFLGSLALPAIGLSPARAGGTRSRIGGLPSLPQEVPWPKWKGRPLAFLCQLALDEIPNECERYDLPESGLLYFFYDQRQGAWGFDPQDAGSWRVIYSSSTDGVTRRSAPPGLSERCVYTEKRIAFRSIPTYPDWQDDRVEALQLGDQQADQYVDLCTNAFGEHPAHHLFGYPTPIQGNDMDLECQLVSHGVYCGDPSGYQDPRAAELTAGRRDWKLLLQLDTDEEAGMMWGDSGMLYYWITREDLRNHRFDKCWMILQCT